MTLIDSPGLSDSEGRDQAFLDKMAKDLKLFPTIDVFVLLLSGDRLGNQTLVENVKILDILCGGVAWQNIVLVITRKDFNPIEYDK